MPPWQQHIVLDVGVNWPKFSIFDLPTCSLEVLDPLACQCLDESSPNYVLYAQNLVDG